VPPKAPLPAEPVRFAVVAATVSTDQSPFIAVRVVTPWTAMRSPFFRRWPAVMVATIGVAFVPPVMRMPRAAERQVPRLRCLMDIVLSFTEIGPVIPQEEGDPAAPPAQARPASRDEWGATISFIELDASGCPSPTPRFLADDVLDHRLELRIGGRSGWPGS
jgi:hypothetical protein